jgi:hypothetical protein
MLGRIVGRHNRRRRRLGRVWCDLKLNKRMDKTEDFGAIGSRRRVVIVEGSIGPSWPVCARSVLCALDFKLGNGLFSGFLYR